MEISSINPHGYKCSVIFVGSHYYFYSEYAGLFAIAERVNTRENIHTNKQDFILTVGNSHLLGGSLTPATCVAIAKRFIDKSENKYISRTVNYEVRKANLENYFMRVEAIAR